jgi:hypothetical protein
VDRRPPTGYVHSPYYPHLDRWKPRSRKLLYSGASHGLMMVSWASTPRGCRRQAR